MKILWHSNAPWAATGYGNQTATFCPRIKAAGHDIAISAYYGLNGSNLTWMDMQIYPGGMDGFGNDVWSSHALQHFDGEPGWVIPLMDAWVLGIPTVVRSKQNVAVWAPVDHDPAPPSVIDFFKDSGATPIAMSRFGETQFKDAGLDPLYVPHGIDTKIYKPTNRKEARVKLGIPEDAFLVGMVGANTGFPSRKSFPECLKAFKTFREKHDDAILYLHTEGTGIRDGVPLGQMLEQMKLPPEAIRFVPQYQNLYLGCDPGYMNAVYNSMDVLLMPSMGEGFGIPMVEAQACGTPVITQSFTACAELGDVGWQIEGQDFYTAQRSYQRIPNIEQIEWALEQAYTGAGRKRKAAAEFGKQYDADVVMEKYWTPVLAELESRLEQEPEVLAA